MVREYYAIEPHEPIVEDINSVDFNPTEFNGNKEFNEKIDEAGYDKIKEALEIKLESLDIDSPLRADYERLLNEVDGAKGSIKITTKLGIDFNESKALMNDFNDIVNDPGTSGISTAERIIEIGERTMNKMSRITEERLVQHEKIMKGMLEEMNKRGGANVDVNDLMKESRNLSRQIDRLQVEELKNNSELNKKINDLKDAYESEGKSLSERFGDLCKALLELAKILASLFSIWFMYNMVNYIFSDCYWIPTLEECTFVGDGADKWKKLQTTKKRMQKKDTMDFKAQLFMQHNNKVACTCQEDGLGLIVARGPTPEENSEYGIIETNDKSGKAILINQGCKNLSNGNIQNDNTIACPGVSTRRGEEIPICLKPKSNSSEDTQAMLLCGGSYQYYNCDLGAMADKFAQLVDDAVNFDYMGLIKLIIYIVVGIIVLYVLIAIIRLIISNRNTNGKS